jgi:transcriptional regulator with XRE-family HTH domain
VRLSGKKPKGKAYPKAIKTIGDAIRKKRLDLGLRQKDVAKIIGCDKTTILNWERGHTHPSANHRRQVTIFLARNRVPKS